MQSYTASGSEPTVLADVAQYWEAANQGKLLIKVCQDCRKPHWYPRAICPHCLSEATAWAEASGRGEIYSYSSMWADGQVYTLAYVTLAEGVTLMTNIVGCAHETLCVGMPVTVVFASSPLGQAVPVFAPGNP